MNVVSDEVANWWTKISSFPPQAFIVTYQWHSQQISAHHIVQ